MRFTLPRPPRRAGITSISRVRITHERDRALELLAGASRHACADVSAPQTGKSLKLALQTRNRPQVAANIDALLLQARTLVTAGGQGSPDSRVATRAAAAGQQSAGSSYWIATT